MSSRNEREQVILQLGDLHFPEFVGRLTDVDIKDDSAPGRLDQALGMPVPHAIRSALVAQLVSHPNAIVAICGDITSLGNQEDYFSGLDYLGRILSDPGLARDVEADFVHLVPGNHDVDFKGSQPFESFDSVERFEALAQACISTGLGDVFTRSSRTTKHTLGDGGVSFISINSCRGTGATRKDVATRVGTTEPGTSEPLPALSDRSLLASVADLAAGSVVEEVLDVPLIHPAELDVISSTWADLDRRFVSVLLAHHGLLPQRTPRLNPYTEMANAGQARSELSRLGRPVIYLHGHVHEHAVELIEFPEPNGRSAGHDRVVIVSAPLLAEGFNKISIRFDAQGYPLGLRIERYRIRPGNQVVTRDSEVVEVSLADQTSVARNERELLSYLIQNGGATGSELQAVGKRPELAMSEDEVESFIESVCWRGLLRRTSATSVPFGRAGFTL